MSGAVRSRTQHKSSSAHLLDVCDLDSVTYTTGIKNWWQKIDNWHDMQMYIDTIKWCPLIWIWGTPMESVAIPCFPLTGGQPPYRSWRKDWLWQELQPKSLRNRSPSCCPHRGLWVTGDFRQAVLFGSTPTFVCMKYVAFPPHRHTHVWVLNNWRIFPRPSGSCWFGNITSANSGHLQ